MTDNIATSATAAAALEIQLADGTHQVRNLVDGDTLIVGSGASCGLQLPGDEISSLHCWIRMADGQLSIQDWNSESGTFVNGQRVGDDEAVVPFGGEIRIGQHAIAARLVSADSVAEEPQRNAKPRLADEPSFEVDAPEPAALLDDATDTIESDDADEPVGFNSGLFESLTDSPRDTDDDVSANDGGHEEVSPLERELDQAKSEILELRTQVDHLQQTAVSQAASADPFDDDLVDMLKTEVEQLQAELAERDLRLTELSELADLPAAPTAESNAGDGAATMSESEQETLIARLEQLLDELEQSDRRIEALESMLQASEEAQRADAEERLQLENWVQEIEQRVREREAETLAEKQVLQRKLEEVTGERDLAEERMQRAVTQGIHRSDDSNTIDDLQEQIGKLRRKITSMEAAADEADRERQQLQRRYAAFDDVGLEPDQIRQQQADLAREKAELARERTEFARLQAEQDDDEGGVANEANLRVRAFRDHLKEIHNQEQQDRRDRSLSTRLSKLWQRLG